MTDILMTDAEDIVLPEEFPTSPDVLATLLNEVRLCVSNNVLRHMNELLEPCLGSSADIFNESILFKAIGLSGSMDLFKGHIPMQQFIGKILHDSEVMQSYTGYQLNQLVNTASMVNTRVFNSTHVRAHSIEVVHIMPDSASLRRYLRLMDVAVISKGDVLDITWTIQSDPTDMSGLLSLASNLPTLLTIYYRLLTRFPSCQSYTNELPLFQNS